MFKLIFEFLTEPLGLPIKWYWEYILLTFIGLIAYVIAFRCVGKMYKSKSIRSKTAGSFFHWLIRLMFFVIIWAIAYGVIAFIKWLCANWVLVLCVLGGIVALAAITTITISIIKKKNTSSEELK